MKIHPGDPLLEELVETLNADSRRMVEHLLECPSCQRRAKALLTPRQNPIVTRVAKVLRWSQEPDYVEILRKKEKVFQSCRMTYDRERLEATGLLTEALAKPPERRRMLLENSPRFHTWGFLELLLHHTREESLNDPARGEEDALLALEIADRLDLERYGEPQIEDMRARAWAYIGNARRLKSELETAEEAFEMAFAHLERGSWEPLERAILLDLRASLAKDRRRFDEALRLLSKAVAGFREIGDSHRVSRSLVNISTVYEHMGSPEQAIPFLYEAVALIDPTQEPRLLLCAQHNLITNLADTGRFMEARGLLTESRALYRRFPEPWTQNRLHWVEGKIARGLGQFAEAERLFLATRDAFLAEASPYDTALVALELASLYAEQGRMGELKQLAESLTPIFSSRKIHREALAAFSLFHRALAAEEASLELMNEVARYLKRSQSDPRLRFEQVASKTSALDG